MSKDERCATCGVSGGIPGVDHGSPEDTSLTGLACTLTDILALIEGRKSNLRPLDVPGLLAEVRDMLLVKAMDDGEYFKSMYGEEDDDDDECEGHESTDGPIGNVVFCDGSCHPALHA